ncbi:MAG: hypothetical protein TREMPRED_002366 [Tremellales sp. Tagirdzhanova-0007]|nr:MAG: hypothetical protein TREMPRED_002366 [Tremellales sp. Tagirdzhanova-0007]
MPKKQLMQLSSLDNLPGEINFLLEEIKDKDARINQLIARIETRHLGLTKHPRSTSASSGSSTPSFPLPIPPGTALPTAHLSSKDALALTKIQAEWGKVEALQEEKIRLADRMERIMNRARERGRAEWKKVGGMDLDELEMEQGKVGMFGEMGNAEVMLPPGGLGSGTDSRPIKNPDAEGEVEVAEQGDAEADETLYCTCRQRSYGEMIGCDNDKCEFEWFHLKCSITSHAIRALYREIAKIRKDPPEGVRIVVDEDDLTAMEGWVQGPAGTPYEGGYFRIRFDFGPEYPNLPPKCTMFTKVFHPNISKSGEICVDTLKKGWKKEYGVGHVLVTIKCLLIYPNPESALDEEAGKQLLADYDGYCKYAKLMTSIHATPKVRLNKLSQALWLANARPLCQIPPPEFRDTNSSTSKPISSSSTPTPNLVPSSAPTSRPPNSTSSATTMSSTSSKPVPLGAYSKQEQSPSIEQIATIEEFKVHKPVESKVVGDAPAVKTGAPSKAKRGLKRL